jgi:hypothetical protein
MKKITLIIPLLLFSIIAFSQSTAFGIKGGLNLTNIKGDAEAVYNSRSGYHAGIFLRERFDKIAFQPELLLFTQKNEVTYTTGTVENSFTYLSIPLLLKVYPIGGFNIHAGPQFGFLLDGEQKWTSGAFTGTKDIKDEYTNSDVSISAGLGWDFKFGLSVDARYNIGIKDVNNAASGENAKSQIFLVSLGWNFLK